jgi:hypothetical protein
MTILGDAIAKCVLDTFKKLPQKAKPRSYPNGPTEWVPLSGIVLSRGRNDAAVMDEEGIEGVLSCVALG